MGFKAFNSILKIVILIISVLIISCGEIIGFSSFPEPNLGDIKKVEVFLSDDSLRKLYDSAHETDWAPCVYQEGNQSINAFIKERGFTSRLYPKKSFTVKIISSGDEIRWAFNASHYSWIKNRIVMYAYLQIGLPALESEGTALFINNTYMGYYTQYDLYNENDLADNYYGISGELFECYFHDMGNDYPLEEYSDKKFPDNNDFTSLNTLVFNARNLDSESWEEWVSNYIDKDEIVKYMVVHDFFAVADTVNVNFYIYNYGKALILPWDNEMALHSDSYTLAGHNMLTSRLMEVPDIFDSYKAEFHRLFLDNDDLLVNIFSENERIFSEIDKAVKEDPTPYLQYEKFLTEVNNMREYLSLGAEGRRAQLLLESIFN